MTIAEHSIKLISISQGFNSQIFSIHNLIIAFRSGIVFAMIKLHTIIIEDITSYNINIIIYLVVYKTQKYD